MGRRPFLELNMLDSESIDANEIKRFTKTVFDLEKILDTSRDLKYTREVLGLLASKWGNPSEALVRRFASQAYEGIKTKDVIEQFERVRTYTVIRREGGGSLPLLGVPTIEVALVDNGGHPFSQIPMPRIFCCVRSLHLLR